jgi:hypothetical protein
MVFMKEPVVGCIGKFIAFFPQKLRTMVMYK